MTEVVPKEKLETLEPEQQTVAPLTEEQRMILGLAKVIEEQKAELQQIKNFLDPKKFDDWLKESLTPLVTNIQKRFEAVEARVGGPQTASGGSKDMMTEIFNLIGKGFDAFSKRAGSGGSSSFGQEIETILHENAKDTFKLVQMDLKDMLSNRAKQLGLQPAATHIVLEAK
jgi:hypothetical protein